MPAQWLKRYLVVLCIAVFMGSAATFARAQTTTPPKLIHSVAAYYPASAFREGIEVTVFVSLTVPLDGIPKDVKILQGFRQDFDQSAIDAVRQWRFRPAMRDGKPIEFRASVEVKFLRPR